MAFESVAIQTKHRAQPDLDSRIGPNAITRVLDAVSALEDAATARQIFERARIGHYLQDRPIRMVPESAVTALQASLITVLGLPRGRAVSHRAGVLTADYLLRHRIPRWLQALLRRLPPRLASHALLSAISRHAWTFCGSGTLWVRNTRPVEISVKHCPLCKNTTTDEPICDYYAGTFERLFRALVEPRSEVTEVDCQAHGAASCRFQIRW